MTEKRKLEKAGYVERTEGWPNHLSGGITVWFMAKTMPLSGEQPALYVAERNGVQAVGASEDEACRELVKKERK